MILQALVQHYEMLADKGKVTKPGWGSAKVSYAIRLGIDGTVLEIVDLRQEETRGKKTVMVPANLEVPQMVSRSSGVISRGPIRPYLSLLCGPLLFGWCVNVLVFVSVSPCCRLCL